MALDASDIAAFRQMSEENLHTLQNLTTVLQGEQERAGKIEASADADRERLRAVESAVEILRIRMDENLLATHAVRKDTAAAHEKIAEVCSRLSEHDARHGAIHASLDELRAGAGSCVQRLADLEDASRRLDSKAQALEADAARQQAQHSATTTLAGALDGRLSAAEAAAAALNAAHQATAQALRDALERTLRPLERCVKEEAARLEDALRRLQGLERQSMAAADDAGQLAASTQLQSQGIVSLSERLGAAEALLKSVQAGQNSLSASSRKLQEQLSDERARIDLLAAGDKETGSMLRKARQEANLAVADCQQRAKQMDSLAGQVAALRAGVEATDGEVGELRALLDVPRAGEGGHLEPVPTNTTVYVMPALASEPAERQQSSAAAAAAAAGSEDKLPVVDDTADYEIIKQDALPGE
eukprot:TRINITY_DN71724_c0_g1_i1.p1 TRINITY_DN71724_c0_g1~~TRINITY_DN71724_c0_g1_i1.p1  ORF type:complete len:417 (+),score=130.11 TRINITY_DN71724_c0_g1_i1:83-1333(+)